MYTNYYMKRFSLDQLKQKAAAVKEEFLPNPEETELVSKAADIYREVFVLQNKIRVAREAYRGDVAWTESEEYQEMEPVWREKAELESQIRDLTHEMSYPEIAGLNNAKKRIESEGE